MRVIAPLNTVNQQLQYEKQRSQRLEYEKKLSQFESKSLRQELHSIQTHMNILQSSIKVMKDEKDVRSLQSIVLHYDNLLSTSRPGNPHPSPPASSPTPIDPSCYSIDANEANFNGFFYQWLNIHLPEDFSCEMEKRSSHNLTMFSSSKENLQIRTAKQHVVIVAESAEDESAEDELPGYDSACAIECKMQTPNEWSLNYTKLQEKRIPWPKLRLHSTRF